MSEIPVARNEEAFSFEARLAEIDRITSLLLMRAAGEGVSPIDNATGEVQAWASAISENLGKVIRIFDSICMEGEGVRLVIGSGFLKSYRGKDSKFIIPFNAQKDSLVWRTQPGGGALVSEPNHDALGGVKVLNGLEQILQSSDLTLVNFSDVI